LYQRKTILGLEEEVVLDTEWMELKVLLSLSTGTLLLHSIMHNAFHFRGIEYEFRVDASCEYPFYLSTDVSGNGRGRYDKGGLAFYCEGKVLKFTPTEDTPDTLYYQCLYEERMGGQIDVRDLHPDPASELKPSLFFVLSLFLYLFIHLI
jgi:hypothetical protein